MNPVVFSVEMCKSGQCIPMGKEANRKLGCIRNSSQRQWEASPSLCLSLVRLLLDHCPVWASPV